MTAQEVPDANGSVIGASGKFIIRRRETEDIAGEKATMTTEQLFVGVRRTRDLNVPLPDLTVYERGLNLLKHTTEYNLSAENQQSPNK